MLVFQTTNCQGWGMTHPGMRHSKPTNSVGILNEHGPHIDWSQQPWLRIHDSTDAIIATLLAAAREVRTAWISYHGGSGPAAQRQILPAVLFSAAHDGGDVRWPVYLIAWCARRQAIRLFRTDRIESVQLCEASSATAFPIYRALGEIEQALYRQYHLRGDDLQMRQHTNRA